MMTNLGNRVTQGQFSFLPNLTDAQITAQIKYALGKGWALGIEYTDDPHPRNTYWEMFGNPMFDMKDPAGILLEVNNCRKTFPNHYIRVTAFSAVRGVESVTIVLHCQSSKNEPGFGLVRQETDGRTMRYTIHSYAPTRLKASAILSKLAHLN